jgi:hypothetical protein
MSSTSRLLQGEKDDDTVDKHHHSGNPRRRNDMDEKYEKVTRRKEKYAQDDIDHHHRHKSTSFSRRHHSKQKKEERYSKKSSRESSGRHPRSHSHRRHHDRSQSPTSRKRSRHSSYRDHDEDGHDNGGRNERYRQERPRKEKRHRSDSGKSQQVEKVQVDLPTSLVSIGPIRGNPPKTRLDPEQDYFAYHDHLRLYLYRHKGQYFEDLTSSEAHKVFVKFCSKYNQGKLEEGFYDDKELPQEAMEQCKRTKHKWAFATTVAEEKSLDMIKAGVKKQTLYNVKTSSSGGSISRGKAVIAPRDDENRIVLPVMGSSNDHVQQQHQQREAILKSLGMSELIKGKKIEIAPRKDDAM